MKLFLTLPVVLLFTYLPLYAQDSPFSKIGSWFSENKISIRKTFDGSVNENNPASISFQENHRSDNDYFNVDLAVKLSEWELLPHTYSVLLFYPKVEWHKSSDSSNAKNLLDGGINFEFIPVGLKSPNLPAGLPNKGATVAPWIQGTTSYRRNIIEGEYETELALQISLISNYKFLPGSSIRDGQDNFRARYYPYVGVTYINRPSLKDTGEAATTSTFFLRLFAEVWLFPETFQLVVDGSYRELINNRVDNRTSFPYMNTVLYFFPGKQDAIGIGFDYRHGFDSDSGFRHIQISSLRLSWKI